MGPLDMKGLLGAATVMSTHVYGAGHVWTQVGYIIAVVQNSQVGLGISMELTTFRKLVCNRFNVFYSMYVGTWNIPKNRWEGSADQRDNSSI